MATITKQTIKVDLTPGRVYPVLHVSQGDVGLEALEFYIYQNGQPYPIPSEVTAINIDGMTPVGVFSYACTWTGNIVTAGVTATMTAERGIDICEIALYDATFNKLGTCNFVISVEESPFTNAHVSTSDMATIMAAASSAQQYELLAKSWAVGDTGIRTGEDTNNSKYWSEQSEAWADMAESWAVGGTGKRTGEDTNNSEYWSGVAHQYANTISFKTYDTVAQMKADTGLLDGGVCRTLGYNTENDGGGALYVINPTAATGKTNIALDNGKYAEMIDGAFVTPEMFGAVGDGVTDDINAIKACIESGYRHVVMSRRYYISTPINNIPDNILIDGRGSIISNSAVFEIDGGGGYIIRDLSLTFKTYGIHVTSTNRYAQYAEFQNLILNGLTSSSVGVYLERTTKHLNELRFTNIICWGVCKGFVVYNPDATIECASHRFMFCSAEQATDYGWELTNADSISLIFSRLAEANGYKIKTVGACNRLVIVGDLFKFQEPQEMSADTYGVVLGCFRSGDILNNTFGGYTKIVKGKTIACDDFLTEARGSESLNSDRTYPFNGTPHIYQCNSWHKFGNSASTLTLDPDYYGGRGLINDLYIFMGQDAGAINIVNGDFSATIPTATSNKTYHLKFINVNGGRRWRFSELSNL